MRTDYEYIRFQSLPFAGKTTKWKVINISSGDVLGTIFWYGPWRQYCFHAYTIILSRGCMSDIIDFINQLMEARNENTKE